MTPYYQDSNVTIINGDSREFSIPSDSIITDPVWPNAKAELFGRDDPNGMLKSVLDRFYGKRIAIQVGCDTDARFSYSVPERFRFFRHCWLEYACPTRKGRLLYTGDVAWLFGQPPPSKPGLRVISGRCISTDAREFRAWRERAAVVHKKFSTVNTMHPCPRRLEHLLWLVSRWSEEIILDPFMGSGTTLLAAKLHGKKAIGIEIEEKYCEVAASRLQQEVFQL
jgi:hypothetical protein